MENKVDTIKHSQETQDFIAEITDKAAAAEVSISGSSSDDENFNEKMGQPIYITLFLNDALGS